MTQLYDMRKAYCSIFLKTCSSCCNLDAHFVQHCGGFFESCIYWEFVKLEVLSWAVWFKEMLLDFVKCFGTHSQILTNISSDIYYENSTLEGLVLSQKQRLKYFILSLDFFPLPGVGGNLVAVQASRISTYLHMNGLPMGDPNPSPRKCPTPCTSFFGSCELTVGMECSTCFHCHACPGLADI